MKAAPLTLCLACAAPAFADVAVPQPAPKNGWATSCAARLDEAAKRAKLPPGAKASIIPLLHEDGTPNFVQYVEYATMGDKVTVGEDAELYPDIRWSHNEVIGVWFRRLHHRFGKIQGEALADLFRPAIDACLKMGETK